MSQFAVGETVWMHHPDDSGLWDHRPWRVARIGPQYDWGLAIELHTGPENRCAVGAVTLITYIGENGDNMFYTLRRERELSGTQLDMFAALEAAP